MIRTLLRLAPLLLLSACASAGGVAGDPLSRTFQWTDVMAGNDIRRSCGPGAPERWRFLYNGIYSEQVRVYEIADGTAETKVFNRLGIGYMTTFSVSEFIQGARTEAPIAPDELRRLIAVWERDLPKAVKPVGHLRSDRFFWTVTACREGRFVVSAFNYPGDGSNPFAFPEALAAFDRSGKPVNEPRPFRDAGAMADFTPSRHNRGDDSVRFLLRVTEDGIRSGY